MAKIIKYDFRNLKVNEKEALQLLAVMDPEDVLKLISHIMAKVMNDIHLGLQGEIGYKDSPFFEAIDSIYQEHTVNKGCYMCDDSIDANAVPFNYPETPLCLTCQLKLANVMKSMGLNPQSFFPGIGPREIQPVLYKPLWKELLPSEN